MPNSNSDISKNDRNRAQTEHAVPEDIPGNGQARRAANAIRDRKARNRAALKAAMASMGVKRKKQ